MKQKDVKFNQLPYPERVKFFATGRVTVGIITQVRERDLVNFFAGKVRGYIVPDKTGNYKFENQDDARKCAREFIQYSRQKLLEIQNAA